MTIYLVALTSKSDAVWEKIQSRWPNHNHIINDTLAFVSPEGISTSAKVKEEVGIAAGEDGQSGLVIRIDDDASAGVLPSTAVAWLREARK
ncbi:MAG: hypothetical protein OXE83_01290 [Gammaproteobacteria bacterium]|nr:hypothetical protein [Gammaproteobacteria bacterium]